MALIRRIISPRDRHRVTTPTGPPTPSGETTSPAAEEKETDSSKLVSGHRRHKSEEQIVIAVDPAIFDEEEPPELPPRNRSDSSGGGGSFTFGTTGSGYRRTQSSGTATMSASFKTTGHAARKPQEDYFVPADTLRHLTNSTISTKGSSHEKRLMSMHDKIVSHNAPEFRASQKPRARSFEKLVDTGDYSEPFDVLQEYKKANAGGTAIPPPKPKRTPVHKIVKESNELSGGTDPPNYLPPPPPSPDGDESTPEQERRNTMSPSGGGSSPHSPSISVTRGGDYDDPWDSNKFKRIRPKADSSSSELQPSRSACHIDPYKSPRGSNSELSETEPPLPPKPSNSPPVHTTQPDHLTHTTHHHNSFSVSSTSSSSPPPPPVPESSRPRACTDINQQPSLPPAFPIDTSVILEEQPWYHGRIGRDQAEDILRNQPDFSFLVRNSESCRMDYSLSIRDSTSPAAHGFIHLKISSGVKGFVLGEFSNPFRSVPDCISFYTQKPLTIKNIHHRRLGFPVGRIQFTHH